MNWPWFDSCGADGESTEARRRTIQVLKILNEPQRREPCPRVLIFHIDLVIDRVLTYVAGFWDWRTV